MKQHTQHHTHSHSCTAQTHLRHTCNLNAPHLASTLPNVKTSHASAEPLSQHALHLPKASRITQGLKVCKPKQKCSGNKNVQWTIFLRKPPFGVFSDPDFARLSWSRRKIEFYYLYLGSFGLKSFLTVLSIGFVYKGCFPWLLTDTELWIRFGPLRCYQLLFSTRTKSTWPRGQQCVVVCYRTFPFSWQ